MNIDHKKPTLGLLITLAAHFSFLFSGSAVFVMSVLLSSSALAHPNFNPQNNDEDKYQYNEQYMHQSVGHSKKFNTAHSPFMAYPEMVHPWELADNHNDHQKFDRKRFEELSPAQREQLKKRREAFKSLPPEEKERIYRAREKFYDMPPEKRQRLKEKWRNMSPEERKQAHERRRKSRKD